MGEVLPFHFKRKTGQVFHASPQWNRVGSTHSGRGLSPAQRAGLSYERKVVDLLYTSHPGFVPHLPFAFAAEHSAGYAIPDGLVLAEGEVFAIEIKSRWTGEGRRQLFEFYIPILQKAWPDKKVFGIEVCRTAERAPREEVVESFVEALTARREYAVLPFTGRKTLWR